MTTVNCEVCEHPVLTFKEYLTRWPNFRAETGCEKCKYEKYRKENPDWKKDHPCQRCNKPVHHKKGVSYIEWADYYWSYCSNECRKPLYNGIITIEEREYLEYIEEQKA